MNVVAKFLCFFAMRFSLCGYYLINICCCNNWFAVVLTGMHLWRAKYGSFMRSAQVNFCARLIVVPLTTFHRLSEVIGDPQGELIFLFHTARCGSTLLTQVDQW